MYRHLLLEWTGWTTQISSWIKTDPCRKKAQALQLQRFGKTQIGCSSMSDFSKSVCWTIKHAFSTHQKSTRTQSSRCWFSLEQYLYLLPLQLHTWSSYHRLLHHFECGWHDETRLWITVYGCCSFSLRESAGTHENGTDL